MTILHFVRHGQKATGEAGDPPLSPIGREQAEGAARCLADEPITRVYSSPLLRARETAEIIASTRGLAVAEDALLRERANWGDLPGQTRDEFDAMWRRCNQDRTFVPAIGDSSAEAGRRIERFVAAVGPSGDATVVAVTHGGVLADFLLNVWPESELEGVNSTFMRNPYGGDVMRECSITSIRGPQPLQILRIAATEHL